MLLACRYDTGEPVAIECREGRIAAVTAAEAPAAEPLPFVAPGLFDVQVNGYGGQEFSSPRLTPSTVVGIARIQATFGVTRFCPTVTTAAFEVLSHALATIHTACRTSPETARRIAGIHLEGPYLSMENGPRGAHPREHCRDPDFAEFQELQFAAGGRIRLLTLAPELDGAVEFIRRVAATGVVVAIGHTAADGAAIRAAVDAGARLSTHLGNGAHLLLPRHPNYLWDQLAEDRLWASLIVDGHHLPPEVVKTFIRAKTPERCLLVSDLSGMAGHPAGRHEGQLCDLEVLDDGRLVVAGQRELLAGAAAPVTAGIANAMHFAGVDLSTAVAMATERPAALLGLPIARLAPGEPADLVLFRIVPPADQEETPTFEVLQTLVAGAVAWPAGGEQGATAHPP